MENKKHNDFTMFEQRFTNEIEDNIRDRKEVESNLISHVEDQFFNLKMDFAKEKKNREENEERDCTGLDEQIASLEEEI